MNVGQGGSALTGWQALKGGVDHIRSDWKIMGNNRMIKSVEELRTKLKIEDIPRNSASN
jgi:hypothetical protein